MNLTEDQKLTYLANLFAVSRADGSVSPSESLAIEAAATRIGAKKSALNKAEAAVSTGSFDPAPVGLFSAQIANLEDMLLVALADGLLDHTEKPVIISFAQRIGVSNDQLNRILAGVKAFLKSATETRACLMCSEEVPKAAKFCPKCGVALEQAEKASATAIEYSIPSVGIAIEFPESTASGYLDAVRKAKEAPEYADCLKGKKTWHMAAWPRDRIDEAVKLVADLKGMRNRRVWMDGSESRWDEVFGFAACSQRRDSAFRPIEYCFGVDEKRLNLWGCRNAGLDWNKWSSWFSYGKFRPGKLLAGGHVFEFDKKRIRHELETNLFRFRYCPNLNYSLIWDVLELLPNQVEVTPNGQWAYKEDYEESPGCIRVVEKTTSDGYTYTNEFYSSGVVPKSPAIGLDILRKAVLAARTDASFLTGVLSYNGD